MNSIISIQRLRPYIHYKLTLNIKTWLIQLIAFFGIFTLFSGLFFIDAERQNMHFFGFYHTFYNLTFFACAMYITSRSFHELSGTSKGFLFMQLPISVLEKFSLVAICTSIAFPLLFTGFYILVAKTSNLMWSSIYGIQHYSYAIPAKDFVGILRFYLLLQPLFLIGSIKFKKQHLLWSTVSLTAIFSVFLAIWISINKLFSSLDGNYDTFLGTGITLTETSFVASDILIFSIAIAAWIVGYYQLKEREV